MQMMGGRLLLVVCGPGSGRAEGLQVLAWSDEGDGDKEAGLERKGEWVMSLDQA